MQDTQSETGTPQLKPIKQPIKTQDVFDAYRIFANTPIAQNIQLACEAANKVRCILSTSTTHPDSATYTEKELQEAKMNQHKVRTHSNIMATLWTLFSNDFQANYNYFAIKRMHETGFGNCGEYCLLVLDEFTRVYPQVNAEKFAIKGGDHVFVVIGRPETSDPVDFKTWGNEAVVCDAWAGEVYPAWDIPNKLLTHRQDRLPPNNIGRFFPEKHQIQLHKRSERDIETARYTVNKCRAILLIMLLLCLSPLLVFSKLDNIDFRPNL